MPRGAHGFGNGSVFSVCDVDVFPIVTSEILIEREDESVCIPSLPVNNCVNGLFPNCSCAAEYIGS